MKIFYQIVFAVLILGIYTRKTLMHVEKKQRTKKLPEINKSSDANKCVSCQSSSLTKLAR